MDQASKERRHWRISDESLEPRVLGEDRPRNILARQWKTHELAIHITIDHHTDPACERLRLEGAMYAGTF